MGVVCFEVKSKAYSTPGNGKKIILDLKSGKITR